MTCRAFGAQEAHDLGLVNRLAPLDALDGEVDALAHQLAAKALLPIQATKRHVDAVTSAMVGLDRSWSDADSLVSALHDPECRAAAARYLEGLRASAIPGT